MESTKKPASQVHFRNSSKPIINLFLSGSMIMFQDPYHSICGTEHLSYFSASTLSYCYAPQISTMLSMFFYILVCLRSLPISLCSLMSQVFSMLSIFPHIFLMCLKSPPNYVPYILTCLRSLPSSPCSLIYNVMSHLKPTQFLFSLINQMLMAFSIYKYTSY